MKKKDFKAFQSNFLAKEDLPQPRILTIKSVEEEEIKGEHGQEAKPVMAFRGFDKLFIVNNINWDVIENAYGPDSDDWIGKPIECFVDPNVMFGKERVGGVRVRLPNGRQVAPAQSLEEPMWDLTQAITEAGKVGIDKPTLISRLKEMGRQAYSPATDTALVRQWIEQAQAEQEFNAMPSAQKEESFG